MTAFPPPEQIQLVATLTAKPGKERDLRDAIAAIIPSVRTEPGCISYDLHVDRQAPDRFFVLEVWQDQASLDTHGNAAPFQSLAARFHELLASPLDLALLSRIV